MIKLNEKYADVIAAMKADAEANVAEATELKNVRKTDVEDCLRTVTDLQDVADSAKSQFSQSAKALKKMGRYKSPNPDMVESEAEPFSFYVEVARKLPKAEKNLEAAKDDLSTAEWSLAKAEKELSIISLL